MIKEGSWYICITSQSWASDIVWPGLTINMLVILRSCHPLSNAIGNTELRFSRNSKISVVKGKAEAINVIGASNGPASIVFIVSYGRNNRSSIQSILIDRSFLSVVTLSQRSSWCYACYSKDIGNRPRIIKTLNWEKGYFNEGVIIFSKHAFPLLIFVGRYTLSCWRINFIVWNLHEV